MQGGSKFFTLHSSLFTLFRTFAPKFAAMILIADSGSTKTDWVLLNKTDGSIVASVHTAGINPVHQSAPDIRNTLDTLKAQLPAACALTAVRFYGAGCTPQHAPLMGTLLQEVLGAHDVQVQSDLMAAAHALCGRQEGIACILGTGANSGLYDGSRMVQNTPALGYILGDEGSGAVLGRLFMNAIFKDPAFAAVRDDFLAEQQLTMADIIRRVYREPMANRFLASVSLYVGQHIDNELLHKLVVDNFRQFFRRNVAPYRRPDLPVHFVGSMAHHYPDQLAEAAQTEGFSVGRVVRSPMDGLISYHTEE